MRPARLPRLRYFLRPWLAAAIAAALAAGGCASFGAQPPAESRTVAAEAMQSAKQGKVPADLLKIAQDKLARARRLEAQHDYAESERLYQQVAWDIQLARARAKTLTLQQQRDALNTEIGKLEKQLAEARR